MDSVSPVFTEREVECEQVIGLNQPEYFPIIVARIRYEDNSLGSVARFRFSEKERAQIAAGQDLLIAQPHHGSWMPISVQLAMKDSYPEG